MHFTDEVAETPDGVALDVEFGTEYGFEGAYVRIADVALIRSGMDRDALCPKAFAIDCGTQDIRHVAAPRIPQRGDLVDVNT